MLPLNLAKITLEIAWGEGEMYHSEWLEPRTLLKREGSPDGRAGLRLCLQRSHVRLGTPRLINVTGGAEEEKSTPSPLNPHLPLPLTLVALKNYKRHVRDVYQTEILSKVLKENRQIDPCYTEVNFWQNCHLWHFGRYVMYMLINLHLWGRRLENRILITIGCICQQTRNRLTQERVGWFASKNEREQRGSRKPRTCSVGSSNASHP